MNYARAIYWPAFFTVGLLLAAAWVLGGCSIPNSRDQLDGPSAAQLGIEPLRPVIFGWAVW